MEWKLPMGGTQGTIRIDYYPQMSFVNGESKAVPWLNFGLIVRPNTARPPAPFLRPCAADSHQRLACRDRMGSWFCSFDVGIGWISFRGLLRLGCCPFVSRTLAAGLGHSGKYMYYNIVDLCIVEQTTHSE